MPSPVSPLHSTLELAQHDATASAPERDDDATGLNHDTIFDAPQTAPVPGPELFYSTTPLEAVRVSGYSKTAKSTSLELSQPRRLSRRTVGVISTIVTPIIVGIAVGVGAGVGLKQRRFIGSDSSTKPAGPRYSNDTSLAAVELSNGDRRVFVQEASGKIRLGSFSPSTEGWETDIALTVASDAKNHTPIAALESAPTRNSEQLVPWVFYIDIGNNLACRYLGSGGWTRCSSWSERPYSGIAKYAAAADSRHLMVTALAIYNCTFLLFESAQGDITFLNGSFGNLESDYWAWNDASSELLAGSGISSDSKLAAPFAARSYTGYDPYEAVFASKSANASQYQGYVTIGLLSGPSPHYLNRYAQVSDFRSKSDTDVLILHNIAMAHDLAHYLVNDNVLTVLNPKKFSEEYLLPNLTTPFPFTRLAGFNQANSSNFCIYHQVNATALGEETWDSSLGHWTSRVIDIQIA